MDRPQRRRELGYYEAPDGENEALFAADYIAKYLREAHSENGETPRAAVLYRTNSQSRLFEEAMRRYQMKYHVVGGFSFYERAEIKDMISYLKVIHNPDDSIALQRVINTPARGIGKTTMETLERIALETGLSLWGAISEAIQRRAASGTLAGGAERFHGTDRRCTRDAPRKLSRTRGTNRGRDAAARCPTETTCSTISTSRPKHSATRTRRRLRPMTSPMSFQETAKCWHRSRRRACRGIPCAGRSSLHGGAAEIPARPHRLHQAAGAGRHPGVAGPHREPARTGECRHGLARPRRDAERISGPCRAGQRCRSSTTRTRASR